jgi:hypothetical protein
MTQDDGWVWINQGTGRARGGAGAERVSVIDIDARDWYHLPALAPFLARLEAPAIAPLRLRVITGPAARRLFLSLDGRLWAAVPDEIAEPILDATTGTWHSFDRTG